MIAESHDHLHDRVVVVIADTFDRVQSGSESAWGGQRFWFEWRHVKGPLRGSATWRHGVGAKPRVVATLWAGFRQ